jgi:pimeloyl-ACP methyl ester carboxylesterase
MTARSVPGMRLLEHRLDVPLTAGDDGRRIEVFAREVRAAAHADDDRPYLLMLNGGPGMAAQRPLRAQAWLERALQDFHVVLLDQRGTGLSTPATAQTLPADPAAQAEWLAHLRADGIVRDAEHVRRALLGDEPWSVLGQSFGGFTALTYLSFAPEGVREAFITGGLPSLHRPALDVYRATLDRLEAKIAAYLERYPDDGERWEAVLDHVARTEVVTPRGRRLTPNAVRFAGEELGMSTGPEQVHYLVEHAFTPGGALSATFTEQLERRISFALAPLYAILHEPIYAQGEATGWAAQRAADERAATPLFWGEMVFPWMFAEDPALQPLREAAELLAAKEDWAPLYDPDRLAKNEIPVVAAVYLEDLYVEAAFSLETAEHVGNLRAWVTNEFDHDGIHVGKVLDRLIAMRRGEA